MPLGALAGIQARNDGGLGHVSRSGREGTWVDSRSFMNIEQTGLLADWMGCEVSERERSSG